MAPVIGSFFKMAVPFIVILPGLLGLVVLQNPDGSLMHLVGEDVVARASRRGPAQLQRSAAADDGALLGPGLLGLGITALIAGFMSGMAGNVSAFSAVWTYDIYQPLINKKGARRALRAGGPLGNHSRRDRLHRHGLPGDERRRHHGLRAGAVQLLHLAAAWRRADGHVLEARDTAGGFWGLLLGTLTSIGLWAWVKIDPSALRYVALSPDAKTMAENMYRALWSVIVSVVVDRDRGQPVRPSRDPWPNWMAWSTAQPSCPTEEPVPFYKNEWFWTAIWRSSFRGPQHLFLVGRAASVQIKRQR